MLTRPPQFISCTVNRELKVDLQVGCTPELFGIVFVLLGKPLVIPKLSLLFEGLSYILKNLAP